MKLVRYLLVALTLLTFSSFSSFAQKKVCITIDDLPVVGYGMNKPEEWKMITERLVTTLTERNIPAIGYVNEKGLEANGHFLPERLEILELWLKNGLELGNHTYSHLDYHKSDITAYEEEILKGEKHLRPLMEKYDKELKYFRHPYLRSGDTQESSEALDSLLDELSYTPAPVTLDSDDYLFAKSYAMALRKGDSVLMKKVGEAYINHTEKKLHFYERLSEEVFGRNIDHTYLMHANLLNADYLGKLADMFERNGYTFISQAEVLKDEAYTEPVTEFGPWGMSWIYRWALSKDKGRALFNQDIPVPEFIQQLSK